MIFVIFVNFLLVNIFDGTIMALKILIC